MYPVRHAILGEVEAILGHVAVASGVASPVSPNDQSVGSQGWRGLLGVQEIAAALALDLGYLSAKR